MARLTPSGFSEIRYTGWISSLQSVAINRLVAHFLFWKPLDYDDMRESTKTAPDSAIPATRGSKPSALTRVRDNIPESGGRYGKQPLGVV
jgi:hypothetical protein